MNKILVLIGVILLLCNCSNKQKGSNTKSTIIAGIEFKNNQSRFIVVNHDNTTTHRFSIDIIHLDGKNEIKNKITLTSNSSSTLLGFNSEYFVVSNFSGQSDNTVVFNATQNIITIFNKSLPALGHVNIFGDFAYGASDLGTPAIMNLKTGDVIRYDKVPFLIGSFIANNNKVLFFSNPIYINENHALEMFVDGTFKEIEYDEVLSKQAIANDDLWTPLNSKVVDEYSKISGIPVIKY